MNIENIQVNHMTEPLGFDLSDLKIEFAVNSKENVALEKKLEIFVNGKFYN